MTSEQFNNMKKIHHIPVLLHEVLQWLDIQSGDVVLDLNLGGAGHSRAICDLNKDITLIGIDADSDAIERSKNRLADVSQKIILEQTFSSNFPDVLQKKSVSQISKVLFDLGLSSDQFEVSGRGFSFQIKEDLGMTFIKNPTEADVTAKVIVNEWGEESLADIIYGFGEERYSRRIAQKIVEVRTEKSLETTADLAEVIKSAVPVSYRHGKIHPATKTFQALRIAVNKELEHLQQSLDHAIEYLVPGGRIVAISFHSLEDRILKRTFRKWKEDGKGEVLTKKPIGPSDEEVRLNSRSRSAKLRVFEKN